MARPHRVVLAAGLLLAVVLGGCGPLSRTGDLTAACTSVLEAIDAEPGSVDQVRAITEVAEQADEGDNPQLAQLGEEIVAALDAGDLQRADELLDRAQSHCEDQGGI